MQAWSWDDFIFNDVDRCGRLFLLDASLVIGVQAWSLDDFIFHEVARCGRLFLLDARKPGRLNA